MSCPWAKIEKPEPVNFEEILSEELAKDLQEKENKKLVSTPKDSGLTEVLEQIPFEAITDECYENDEAIAKLLQMQYDKEYDLSLKRIEGRYNGSSKISISFENYQRATLNDDFISDSEEDEIIDISERKDWDRFDAVKREFESIPQCGYRVKSDGKMITKHDKDMNGRKNACRMLSFPPEFQTGDGENFDLKLSNKVFNSLKIHSSNEQSKRRHKLRDKKEDRATAVFGVDENTALLLYKMIESELLETIRGVIRTGKESVVVHADVNTKYDGTIPILVEASDLPRECAIKLYKKELSEFKHRDMYINDDIRFKDRIGKQKTVKTIHLWSEKEMVNLMRLSKAGIPCPQVIKYKKCIVVMSFIGENRQPAPQLKDAVMSNEQYQSAYDQVINGMKTMYDKANLIHADLSEYNILWYKNTCYFIDVSQSVEPYHENAFYFLYRDCNNVINFFTKRQVPEVLTPDELFTFITGCDYNDTAALKSLKKSFKLKPHLMDMPGVATVSNFEADWEDSKKNGEPSVVPNVPVETSVSDINLSLVESPKA